MKYLLFFIISTIFIGACKPLLNIGIRQINKQGLINANSDSIIISMLVKNNLVLKLNTQAGGRGKMDGFPFYYVGFSKDKAICLKLDNSKSESQSFIKTDTFNLDNNYYNDFLEIFRSEKWNLNYDDRDSAGNFCFYQTLSKGKINQCEIMDGTVYNLQFYTQLKHTNSFLYAPFFYETKCCSGNINRQNLIKIKNLIESVSGMENR